MIRKGRKERRKGMKDRNRTGVFEKERKIVRSVGKENAEIRKERKERNREKERRVGIERV